MLQVQVGRSDEESSSSAGWSARDPRDHELHLFCGLERQKVAVPVPRLAFARVDRTKAVDD